MLNERRELRRLERASDQRLINLLIRKPKRDVAPNRVVEQEDVLRIVPDLALPGSDAYLDALTIDENITTRWLEQTKEQVDQRCLSCSRRPNETYCGPSRDPQRHVANRCIGRR